MKAQRVPVVGVSWDDLVRSFSGSRTEVRELVAYCRVFSAEDAMRFALVAYGKAVRRLSSPDDESKSWVFEGSPWSSPKDFVEDFMHEFQRQVWDVCARSERYIEVERWTQERAKAFDFAAPQEQTLPLCGSVEGAVESAGVRDAT
jgi:hypothetical protein